MKKRILSLLLAAVLLCALLPVSPARAADLKAFSDIPSNAWYDVYVYALVQKGIINGMTPSTFAPTQPLTRAQLMKMLACFAADDAAIKAAAGEKKFKDVPSDKWYAGHVNWAAEQGVTNGYEDGSFRPEASVSRQETATLAARFAAVTDGVELKAVKDKSPFTDDASLPDWAKESVYLCQQAGVISGYPEGDFRGGNKITRAEAAKVLCLLLGVEPLSKDAVPKNAAADLRNLPSTAAGYSVSGIEFNPQAYRANIVLANNRFRNLESAASMVQRSGAAIACNGAYFANNGDLTTASAMVRNGKAIAIENSKAGNTCYFVIDTNGRASMQFLSIQQTVTLKRNGETLYSFDRVGCNYQLGEDDGTRMVFTSEYGDTVPVKMKCAVYCDANGVVTDHLDSDTAQTIRIPKNGFVVCCINRRWEGDRNLFNDARPGDKVERTLSYGNSTVQNIDMAFSCGPTVVKNSQAYGNSGTYAAEGFGQVPTGSVQRMAIGVKKDGRVVIAAVTCDLQALGRVMQALGCETAMNLDGGASRALYINGNARIAPGRTLTHLIVFTVR